MVEQLPWGDGCPLFRITDGPFTAELIPYGAALRALWVPDKAGRPVDVVLGYDTLEEYRRQDACFGAVIGRCANRIAGASFSLNGVLYSLDKNEGENTLHGGGSGFHQRFWAPSVPDTAGGTVAFSLHSPDGDQGFPGALTLTVTYTLSGGVLTVDYHARSDRDTVVNLTNHSYWNLSGHQSGSIAGHRFTLHADHYTPADSHNIPTGALAPVAGTPLDLRRAQPLSQVLSAPALAGTRGLDHNFVLAEQSPAATLYSPESGVMLDFSTTMEGLQVYSAGWLTSRPGKAGASYGPSQGLALEAQHFPDAIHNPRFPSPILRAGEDYRQTTAFRFSVP